MIIFTFKSTHLVIKAEKICRKQGLACKIVPVPRSIASDCGMSIEAEEIKRAEITAMLDINQLPYQVHSDYQK